ncbi:MAG: hypothetical protein A2700_01225 [Candidatus Blackburnbacteria bacterium RIFCSPHIGHO2_01_FULL_44_64]|uniref:UPF0102 protein A3D26_04510 n=1 Tax=Candidatus Blackburnbacteria bacterium RIFCSPHIGHO2_02_FULL_44_20 TaxID=1797516 RepID=A0A1G1V4A5_9BACT|nr:MAG: hypothetical protein A2700_01225 [Candidatus Blackburnbacteria bacterium RIFCSPHIGHO2_01_FULL_44_64]OGY10195.1 MAG: hypothetical protein A3D26_04510 [Candidatus Blackburnbacteria bacterium RIFCSPHIGHO2_02_FULL_44_20]OGY10352.1 MAG: hypothetical protein A3E16_02790 [Candidatus Blackburnbacteria bacterium RIFCSPHIGHO2_12_FULL_44_25]OGY15201.1 MAG: hypothetical protein A3A62_02520 [Candidatus Blackburnbacteria bacterium RIFCSPLOWO2_01_FULL_44_43]OGY15837.1 MAG: hypothetical protein A3H88_0
MDRQRFGREGENKAVRFLEKSGYKVLTRNFRSKLGEIDIVAIDHNTLVFVEVKTRRDSNHGYPEEAVTPRKLRSIIKTGEYYKLLNPQTPELLRIDVVAIDGEEVRLLKNVSQ